MLKSVVTVLALGSASAFTPAPVAASRVSMSRVVSPAAPVALEPVVSRTAEVTMSADGEHETLYEMCAACQAAAAAVAAALVPNRIQSWSLLPAAPVVAHASLAAPIFSIVPPPDAAHRLLCLYRFDPGWVIITMLPYTALLLKFGGVF
jgi:hypothetical protein